MRHAWTAAGVVALALGLVGTALPIMPTVPFVILAAFLFGRGSPAFRARLLSHPRFGRPIRDWEERGAISRRSKVTACSLMAVGIAVSWIVAMPGWVLATQVVVIAGGAAFMLSRPS